MHFVSVAKRVLPRSVREPLRYAGGVVHDGIDRLLGRGGLRPPRGLIYTGSGDFGKIGSEFLDHFVRLGRLQPDHRVLDVGCGIGRMAIPLTSYLTRGEYDGFDIVPTGIRWCQRNITPRFPSFRFHLADLHNTLYNPGGRYCASEYRFPFADGSFDFVFLTSVFTHLLPEEVANYVREISRVTRPGGKLFATCFLLNEESLALRPRANDREFAYDFGEYRIVDPAEPASAVALREDLVQRLLRDSGLVLQEPIHFGTWCGRAAGVSYQDIVVAVKPDQRDGGQAAPTPSA